MRKNKILSVFMSIIMVFSFVTIFPVNMTTFSASYDVEDENTPFVYRVYDNYVEAIGYSEQLATAKLRGSEFKGLKSYVNNVPVKYISGGALKGAPITELYIPDTVIEIKYHAVRGGAFEETNISTVSIPKNVKKIGSNTFKNCSYLKSIYIYIYNPDCVINGNGDTICNSSGVFTGIIYGYKGSTAEDYAIENGYNFASIDGQGTSNSQTTTMPPSTTPEIIDSGSFGNGLSYQLDNLGTLTISGSGTLDVASVFNNPWSSKKDKIKKIIITGDINEIAKNSFHDYKNLNSVIISSPLKIIGDDVFIDCSNLVSVSLPNGIQSIGENAFYRCRNLSSINLPDSISSIGKCAFYYCTNANIKSIPSSLSIINYSTFTHCESIQSISLPDSLQAVEEQAFLGCNSLTSISIPNSVKSIGSTAFKGCTNLSSVTLSSNLEIINNGTFASCTNLITIDIPSSVTKIGVQAFNGCSSMESITIRNPNCDIYDNNFTISSPLIRGFSGSTAEEYAKKYSRSFEAIDNQNMSTITTTTTTQKKTTTTTKKATTTMTTRQVTTVTSNIDAGPAVGDLSYFDKYDVDKATVKPILSLSRIELSVEEARANPTQTISLSIKNAENKYGYGGIRIIWDDRLSFVGNSDNVIKGPALKYNGLLSIVNDSANELFNHIDGNENSGKDGVMLSFPLTIPSDCQPGDIYPIQIKYRNNDQFCNGYRYYQDYLMEAWLFTRGIVQGYIKIKDNDTKTTTQTTTTISTTTNSTTTTTTFTAISTTTSTTATTSPVTFTLGDVNNDSQINAVDASSVLAYYAKISTNQDGGFNEAQTLAADVNHDGQINAVDASNILAYYAYLSTTKEDIISLEKYVNKN